jgi:hypothetical protein
LNLEVFCYLGLLRFPEQLRLSLPLLPDEQRTEAEKFLDSVRELPPQELALRWSRLREGEWAGLRRLAQTQSGFRLEDLAPSFRPFYIACLLDQDGAENPQS